MGRPAKTYAVLAGEGRSHRTKSEMAARKSAEESLLTGERMRESAAVKADSTAHSHWLRVKKLMAAIGRDDAIHEQSINRYCLMLAECEKLSAERARLEREREEIMQAIDDEAGGRTQRSGDKADGRGRGTFCGWMNAPEEAARWEELAEKLFQRMMKIDAAMEKKRAMLLSIEKENLLTVASGLRAVPKKPPEEEADPMAEMLTLRARG